MSDHGIRIVDKGSIALMEWDLPNEKINKLSADVVRRLKTVITELQSSSYKAVVLISRKKNIFIAGADIEEIKKITTKDKCAQMISEGHGILNMLEDLPIPTIAAISGACLGGGCELVLACDYRIADDHKSTQIGLPEVKLGVIPGFGGCVRLPRLVGLPNALDILLAGKAVKGSKALKIGLVDQFVPKEELEQRALKWAAKVAEKPKPKKSIRAKKVSTFLHSPLGRAVVYSQAKKTVMKQTKGFYPAPLAALEVVRKTFPSKARDKALQIERENFCEVAVTKVSKNLIHLFYLMEGAKKYAGGGKAQPVKQIAVLGAGVMGGGIAQLAADKGFLVRLKDISYDALLLGFRSAQKVWKSKVRRRRMKPLELKQKMALISGGLDYSGFGQSDVVIEAVIEDLRIKKSVISETATHCKPGCIMATNTSALSVNELATAHPHPENFLGMHFFNPVHRMPLVEVIKGNQTSDDAVATIVKLTQKMGKVPVVVKDGPGFLVNRLLIPYMAEALFLLEEGMDIKLVDKWYTDKFGLPMGPFRLMDEVGLDVCVKVLKIFREAVGERLEISSLTKKIEELGRWGKKTQAGFYKYDAAGKVVGVDSEIYDLLGLNKPSNPYAEKDVVNRGIYQMINEASRALYEDNIIDTPEAVDLAMVMGMGFPPFKGGLLKMADDIGLASIVEDLELYGADLSPRFRPCKSLVQLLRDKQNFYQ